MNINPITIRSDRHQSCRITRLSARRICRLYAPSHSASNSMCCPVCRITESMPWKGPSKLLLLNYLRFLFKKTHSTTILFKVLLLLLTFNITQYIKDHTLITHWGSVGWFPVVKLLHFSQWSTRYCRENAPSQKPAHVTTAEIVTKGPDVLYLQPGSSATGLTLFWPKLKDLLQSQNWENYMRWKHIWGTSVSPSGFTHPPLSVYANQSLHRRKWGGGGEISQRAESTLKTNGTSVSLIAYYIFQKGLKQTWYYWSYKSAQVSFQV